MSTFRIPTFDELRTLFIDIIRSVIPEAALSTGEDYEREADILSGVSQSLMGPLVTIEDQIFPDTANDENVARHGDLNGISRKGMATATGLAIFPADGNVLPPITQPSGSTGSSQTGVNFFLTVPGICGVAFWVEPRVLAIPQPNVIVAESTAGMIVGDALMIRGHLYVIRDLPGGGAIVIYGRLISIPDLTGPEPVVVEHAYAMVCAIQVDQPGAVGNLEFDTQLTLTAPTSGISAEGSVVILAGGADQETFKEWGRRIKNYRQLPARDANAAEHRVWMENIVGVARSFSYALYRGLGTADDVPQGVAGARHLSSTKLAEIQNDINPVFPLVGRVPVGGHDVQVTDFPDYFVEIDLSLDGGAGYGPDWGPLAISGYYQGSGGTFAGLNGTVLRFLVDRVHEFNIAFTAGEVDVVTTAARIASYDPGQSAYIVSIIGGQVRITSISASFDSTVEILTPNAAAGFPTAGFGIRGGTIRVSTGSTVSRVNTDVIPQGLISEGSRVVISYPIKPFLVQRKVLTVDAAGFVVTEELPYIPIPGTLVYPGSALIEPVRDLLIDMVDNLGPGDTIPPSRFPSPTDEFPADLTLSLIMSTARKAKGLRDLVINAPLTNITPPPKAQIALAALTLRYYS